MTNPENSSSIAFGACPRLPINPVRVSTGRRGAGEGEPAPHPAPPAHVVYSDARNTILHGDVRAALRTLPAASVDCAVTSPPYWGLRDYGLAAQIWGGHADCGHEWISDQAGRSRCR